MFKSEVVDLSLVPEIEKTESYLEDKIKLITDINVKSFHFHVDGGKQGSNKKQKLELYERYINYYRSNVSFLPNKIPEDIIYERSYVLCVFSCVDISKLDSIDNSKDKFKELSEQTSITVESLYDLFISYLILQRTNCSEYLDIVDLLKSILSKSKGVV